MKTRAYSMILVVIILTVLRVNGAVAIGRQTQGGTPQDRTQSQAKMAQHHAGAMEMDMSPMMREPHHVLAMAYKDNLVNFARALHHQANQTGPIDTGFARAAVAEMRRSYDQMLEHHRDHMKAMNEQMKSSMADMMKQMDAHHAAVGEHLTALEKVVHAAAPDAKGISEHVAEILKQCDGMAKLHGGAMGHKMAGPKDHKMN